MSIPLIDPSLGKLDFLDVEGHLSYSCKLALPISNKLVEVFFQTNSINNPPTSSQREFLKFLIDNYDEVLKAIIPQLPNDIEIVGNQLIGLKNQFTLETIGIPLKTDDMANWNLSLQSLNDVSTFLLTNFEGMNPTNVYVEHEPKKTFFIRLISKVLGI